MSASDFAQPTSPRFLGYTSHCDSGTMTDWHLLAYVSRENLRCDFGKSTPMAQKTPNPNAEVRRSAAAAPC